MGSNSIYTVAGTGTAGLSGDGGRANFAQINSATGVAALADGGYLIGDSANHVVRRVAADATITTVAGTGTAGFSGDGGAAVSAQLDTPEGVSPTSDGGFLIADHNNNVVRRVGPDGVISTVAGSGVAGFSGDGGPATSAQLNGLVSVAATADGGFVISDTLNHVIRKVATDGTIATVAGTGTAGFIGDGGPGTQAELDHPDGISVAADGAILIADAYQQRGPASRT